MNNPGAVEVPDQHLTALTASPRPVLGYVYPHMPIELFLAHGITPSLLRTNPTAQGEFESSLQTFSCSLTRNLFSQRSSGVLPQYSGLLFPNNACDSLHNVADVWRNRFPEDRIFKLTYPVARLGEDSVNFLAQELRILSESLKSAYRRSLSYEDLLTGVSLVNSFRHAAQTLYSCRIVDPTLVSYSEVARMVTEFLSNPNSIAVEQIDKSADDVSRILNERGQLSLVKSLQKEMLNGRLNNVKTSVKSDVPRILVTGGMIDPQAIASLLKIPGKPDNEIVVLDLLSFGFKTAFTPQVSLVGDPFVAISRSILGAPSEPTQEGLPSRLEFLKHLLSRLSVDGLVVCEQSFCDPDQFEAPSALKVASDLKVPALRLPLDPELSDRARLEGRIQSFLETLEGGQTQDD